jgi:hypothetical protein
LPEQCKHKTNINQNRKPCLRITAVSRSVFKTNFMFQIGEKVICINNSMQPHTIEELKKDMPNWVKKDEKYTIRGFTSNNGIVDGVWLEEIKNDYKFFRLIDKFQEPAFALWRFRKLEPAEIQMEVVEYADVA